MRFFVKNHKTVDWFFLSVIYILSQGLLLIISGRWWDDWIYWHPNHEVLVEMGMEAGRPELILFTDLARVLPEKGYRIITFIAFYICMLCVYRICKAWLKLNDQACFIISALYAVIPANDARIMLCVFSYTIGLFFFMEGFAFLSEHMGENGLIQTKHRLFSLFLFFISFVLNSNLVFYVLIILMIVMKIGNIKRIIRYWDFLILPIAYYAINSLFFPTYGKYSQYNTVTISRVFNALIVTPVAAIKNTIETIRNISQLSQLFIVSALIVSVALVGVLFIRKNKDPDCELISLDIKLLFLGVIAHMAGLFSYVVVRNNSHIYTSGTRGRDSYLIAFGVALITYSFVRITMKRWAGYVVYSLMILCGIAYFNIQYLSYQQDYYRVLGYQYQLEQHDELKNATNIIYLNADEGRIKANTWYELNAIVNEVYGMSDKLVVSSVGVAKILEEEAFKSMYPTDHYYMSEYDVEHSHFDAITVYSMDISLIDTLKMKVYELVGNSRFDGWIINRSSMEVYLYGEDEYWNIMEEE